MFKHTQLSVEEFVHRRAHFAEQMPINSAAFIKSGEEVTRSNDTEYPFCPNKNFFYLTGFHEPEATLMIIKSEATGNKETSVESVLFCRDKNPQMEVWHGRRVGPEMAQVDYGFDACFNNDVLEKTACARLNNLSSVLCCFDDNELLMQVTHWMNEVSLGNRAGKRAPKSLSDCSDIIHEQRLIKSDAEIALMRRANEISGRAHQRAMEKTKVGVFEYQIEAELLHEFARHGARHAAYGSIVAGGDNANILHYTDNNDVLNNNELLLIDAGGELAGYAADITRTFPVNGVFTAPQKAIYELVLASQIAAIEAIKPGQTFAHLNELVCEVLTKGLYELGILKGKLDKLIQDKACKKFFIHGLGHWLGLDVHDVGDYHANDKRQQLRTFEPGMIMTIEPGIYIPHDAGVDEHWRGIGIRIEDNILVTTSGYENLTEATPKTVDSIEAIMAGN